MGWAGRLGKAKGGRRLVAYDPVAKQGWLGRLPRVADRVLAAVARCGWTDLSGRRAWVRGLFVVECGGSSWPAPPSTHQTNQSRSPQQHPLLNLCPVQKYPPGAVALLGQPRFRDQLRIVGSRGKGKEI